MNDYLVRGIDKNGKFKFVAANTTNLVNEACEAHETSATASAALGRTLTAGALMSTMLKNPTDSLTLIVYGGGELGKILVVVNQKGEIKGYVDNPLADLPVTENGKLDVSGVVGNVGFVKTIVDLGMKEPYIGQSELLSGEIAEDIANYYLTSEQVNTAVALGVLVDKDLSIIKSGGYLIQLLPDATDDDITKLEKSITSHPTLTDMMKDTEKMEDIMKELLGDFELEFLESQDLSFNCGCSREKTLEMLKSLGKDEVKSMIHEDEGAEVICQFCNEKYQITKDELTALLAE